jgi:endoglucanase
MEKNTLQAGVNLGGWISQHPAFDYHHCGEYGVIEGAPMETRVNWMRDFVPLLCDNHIGKAVWSYKAMDFGLVDLDGKIINGEIIKIVCAY